MKTCEDFGYTGVACCMGCHCEPDELITIKVDGEWVQVCCGLADFFYPDGSWKATSPTGGWSLAVDWWLGHYRRLRSLLPG
jgi:hypothetical protein